MINTHMPTVEGAKGAKPVLVFPKDGAPEELQVQILDAGDDRAVTGVKNLNLQSLGGPVHRKIGRAWS